MKKSKAKPATNPQPSLRTVLLAVTGMSPAILTETLWALAQENPPILPAEILVLTTQRGELEIRKRLLETPPGWPCPPFQSLRDHLLQPTGADNLLLLTSRLIELPDPKLGKKVPAEDIRSRSDNDAAADFILEEVRRLTENHETRVIASIAGGRKTMGALLYAAMSLLGREDDRITHVLVSEPYETCREFFFPGQPVQTLKLADGQTLQAAKARIELADLPFVCLRNLFERDFARRPGSFHSLVAAAARQVAQAQPLPPIELCLATRSLKVDRQAIPLSILECILALLLLQNAPSRPFLSQKDAATAAEELRQNLHSEAIGKKSNDWRIDATNKFNDDTFRKTLCSLRQKLRSLPGQDGRVVAGHIRSRGQVVWEIPRRNIRIKSEFQD